MNKKETVKIKLWGIVQGVGFRPYVAKMADALGMKGEVLNIGGLVEITLTDTGERISRFISTLMTNKPDPSEIVHIKQFSIPYREFNSFTIVTSHDGDDETAMIPSDLAICPSCLEELYDKNNPRFMHPFISCMICGPRYTIIDKIPYDRDNTSMVDFSMCGFCRGEYTDLHDRRFHAQTISCHSCGPQLLWKGVEDKAGALHSNIQAKEMYQDNLQHDKALLDEASSILKSGGILLFKSVGGYNLVADPLNEAAVAKLRKIKRRAAKPFAVMFRSMDEIEEYCYINEVEKKLMESSARPIILLEHKELPYVELNKSRYIGSFLPSFAAQYLLLDRISPLIFTSANLSDMPMIKDDDEALALFECSPEIDGILYNQRQIRVRADDSVGRVIDGQPQMIRRSKGYSPVPLYVEAGSSKPSILATGGQLKNSFALTKGPFLYMSQFFGDMYTVENQSLYRENLRRMKKIFKIRPQAVVCDLHPLYFTTSFAQGYAKANNLPILGVQHHHAHVASVMAENNLTGKVIGVSFDGTGYGTDGCIWGGEFLLCEGGNYERIAHLKYVDMIGGDSSVKDAARSALSYIHAYDNGYLPHTCNLASAYAEALDYPAEIALDISPIIQYGRDSLMSGANAQLVYKALDNKINTVKSSSMGRLFDGVSALLGIKTYNDYEGQCAIKLEDAAAFAARHPGESRQCDLALNFHNQVIDMIVTKCQRARRDHGANQVALTGGTFQNKILMEGVLQKLRIDGFEPYYNISVSPNDGGIALGQAYIAMHLNMIKGFPTSIL
ncbi:MAG: carbamoyltransferase HypF [Clostridiales bacterium]|nr:carbamoyltransferase HypF [Clostridiales bacterium]